MKMNGAAAEQPTQQGGVPRRVTAPQQQQQQQLHQMQQQQQFQMMMMQRQQQQFYNSIELEKRQQEAYAHGLAMATRAAGKSPETLSSSPLPAPPSHLGFCAPRRFCGCGVASQMKGYVPSCMRRLRERERCIFCIRDDVHHDFLLTRFSFLWACHRAQTNKKTRTNNQHRQPR